MEELQARHWCPIWLIGVGRQRHRGVRQVHGPCLGAHVEEFAEVGCRDPSEGASDLSECTHLGRRVGENEAAEFKERAECRNECFSRRGRVTQFPIVDQWDRGVAGGPGTWSRARNVGMSRAFHTNKLQDRQQLELDPLAVTEVDKYNLSALFDTDHFQVDRHIERLPQSLSVVRIDVSAQAFEQLHRVDQMTTDLQPPAHGGTHNGLFDRYPHASIFHSDFRS